MKKTAWLALIAFVLAIGVASTSTAKGKNHAMTMEGTVSSVDQNAKTFSLTNKARLARGCSTAPAFSIISANASAEPSMIGTSRLSTSMYALSIPQPRNAASRCSTVESITPVRIRVVA